MSDTSQRKVSVQSRSSQVQVNSLARSRDSGLISCVLLLSQRCISFSMFPIGPITAKLMVECGWLHWLGRINALWFTHFLNFFYLPLIFSCLMCIVHGE